MLTLILLLLLLLIVFSFSTHSNLCYYSLVHQVNIHHNHSTGTETVATNWFQHKGSSPNPMPVPTLPINHSTDAKDKDEGDSSSATASASVTAAVSSTAATDTEGGAGSGTGTGTEQQHRASRQVSSSLRVDFSGVWERHAEDSEKMMSTVMQSGDKANVMQSTHAITMDAPLLSTFQLVETSPKSRADRSYNIGGDYIETSVDGKAFKEKCYWLGDALVIQRLSLANDVEITLTRYLENTRLRLVTVRKNLNTGDNTESVSFFTREGAGTGA